MRIARRLLVGAMFVAILPFTGASAVPVTHNVAVAAGETKTWNGSARVGVNPNYNGLSEQLDPVFGPARTCSTDPQHLCEYALIAATNPVPAEDPDGKLKKSLTVTIDHFTPESPATDLALTLYTTDSTGSVRGTELGTSDNSAVPDPDEQVSVSVTTTLAEPTVYFLAEIAYFIGPGSTYTGTARF